MIELTPGLAQAAFDMLGTLGYQALGVSDVVQGLRRIGGMPAKQVLEFSQQLNWVAIAEDGRLEAAAAGRQILELAAYGPMLRCALLDYAEIISPPWLQNAAYGRSRVLNFAPRNVLQVMVEAEVTEGVADEVVAFWDKLAALARGRRDSWLTDIGRRGERLTINYEEARTGRRPRWVAIDSNEDGYDVLSVCTDVDLSPLGIEVKTSTRGLDGSFFVTRGEWEVAIGMEAHLFHCWDLSVCSVPRLAVVPSYEVATHVPHDQGQGLWTDVEVPFNAFAERFVAVH